MLQFIVFIILSINIELLSEYINVNDLKNFLILIIVFNTMITKDQGGGGGGFSMLAMTPR